MALYGVLRELVVEVAGDKKRPARLTTPGRTAEDINATLLMNRLLVTGSDDLALDHLNKVAASARSVSSAVLGAIHRRRRLAARLLAERRGFECRRLTLVPEWRVVVGHGESTAHETGLTFSTTYGVPIWPGSALKGVTAAYARQRDVSSTELTILFGAPRPGDSPVAESPAGKGAVTVLDALPVTSPKVVVDVLTPHVKDYYDEANSTGKPTAFPAEYHNPVPIRFLAVESTPFETILIGPAAEVDRFTDLLTDAVDELGLGGKTSAGYGYLRAEKP